MLKKYIKNDVLRNILEWALTILSAFVLFLFLQAFVARAAYVSGVSMQPTLEHGDRVLLVKLPYYFANPGYRDIIAFPYKEDRSKHYLKRIIGLPGDVIDMADDHFVINGIPLEDEFSGGGVRATGNVSFPVTVPDKCYFVLGDNRNMSNDSRYAEVGFIPKEEIAGRAIVQIWPLKQIGILK